MDGYRLQIILFDIIRERINDPKNWIDEISEVLNLSKSAVYKKINATSSLSLEELSVLLVKYDINFDNIIQPERPYLTFQFPFIDREVKSFLDYLEPLGHFLKVYSGIPDHRVLYATHELPIFYWLTSRDVCYFKLYAYAKTLWGLEGYTKMKFDLGSFSGEQVIMKEADHIAREFFNMPSVEFWNENTLGHTLNQIKYFANSGFFEKIDDAISLCASLRTLMKHMESMASHGRKFMPGTEPIGENATFELYHNEISHTNNTILVESETSQAVFATYDSPNFIISQDERLIDHTTQWFNKLKEHSLLVSGDANRSRVYLFNQINKRIDVTQQELETLKRTGEAFSV